MNKFFAKVTGFLVCTAMFIGTAAGITVNSFKSGAAAVTTYSHIFPNSKALSTDGGEVTLSGIKWNQSAVSYLNFDNAKGVQVGSGNAPANPFTLSTSAFKDPISSITVNASMGSKGNGKITVSIGGDTVIGQTSLTTSAADYSSGTISKTGTVLISLSATAKAMYIKSITIVHGVEESFEVDYTGIGSNITAEHTESPVSGEYENTLTPDTGYSISSISVLMKDSNNVFQDITSSSVTNGENGAKNINIESVTGALKISATAASAQIYNVTNNLTNVTSNGAATATHGNPYTATLTPASGYALDVSNITVTMGGNPVEVKSTTINIASVTGAIIITASARLATKYVKYTENAISKGDYLLVIDSNAMGNAISSSKLNKVAVSISNDIIFEPEAKTIWTIKKASDGYFTLFNKEAGKYLSASGSADNKLKLSSTCTSDNELWTFSYNSGNWEIKNKFKTGVPNNKLSVYQGGNYFAYYDNAQPNITLFKFDDPRALVSIAINDKGAKEAYNSDEQWDPTDLEVTATYDSGDPEVVDASDITWTYDPATPSAGGAGTYNVRMTASYTFKGTTKTNYIDKSVTVTKVKEIAVTGVSITNPGQTTISVAGSKHISDTMSGMAAQVSYLIDDEHKAGEGKVTWTSSDPTVISVAEGENNTATVTFLTNSDSDVVITATTVDLPQKTATVTFTDIRLKGLSEEYPLTVAEAKGDYFDAYNGKNIYISGVINVIDDDGYAWISDDGSEKAFEIYGSGKYISFEDDLNQDEYVAGSSVLAYGKLYLYKTTYEIGTPVAGGDYSKVTICDITPEPIDSIEVNEDWTWHETEYFYGECFDPTGLVITATRENSEVDYFYDDYPDDFSFSPSLETPLTEDTDITVTYGGKSTTISVTVTKVLDNISIKTAPTKTSYIEGQCFDPTGLVISLNYEGGAPSEDVPYLGNESKFSFSPSLIAELATTDNKVTITYEGESVDQAITVSEKSIASVAIKSFTGKSEYFAGDTLNPTGLTVTITYDNGKTEDVIYSDTTKALFSFSPETFTEAGNFVPVTVTYSGHNAGSFNVKVIPVTLEIIVVEVGTAKTEYYTGDAFDPTGLKITGINNNETEFDIDPKDCTFTGYDMSTPGQQTVTVTYQGETDTYNINVTQVVLESISLSGGKTSFEYGEAFSEGDLVVTAHYNNGDVILEEGYTITGYNPTQVGPQTITVEYQGKTKNYTVTVLPSTVIDHIIISNNASKTTFWISDTFSYQGLEISKVFTDNHKEVLSASDYIVVNPTWEVGEQEVLIKLASDVTKTVSYDIQIKALVLDHIEINTSSVTKTFEYDAEFNHNGLTVEAYYTNGVHAPITNGYTVSNPNMKQVGNQEVIVSYTEGEITKTAKYYINVKQSTVVASIAVKQEPNTVEYQIGDTFDPAGLIIEATYTDGHKAEVTGYYLSSPDMTTSGIKAITVTYKGHTTSFNITIHEEVVLARLDINTDNVKKDYLVYDIFTSEGLVVTAVYTDETEEVITNYKLQVVDMGIKGEKEIIISYGNKTNKYTINVVGRELDNISVDVTKAKVTFDYNEEFSASGLIITGEDNFDESFCIDSSVCTFSGYDKTVRGQQEITVTYNGKTATYNVFVKDSMVVDHIEITSNPSKTEYFVGDRFDPTGLVVNATYTDGRSVDIPKYLIIVEDMSIAGAKTVTISYGGQTDTCNINVTAVTLESITIDTTNAKTEYNIGDRYSNARILVMGQYSNGTTEQIDITQCTITGYDKTTAGEQTVIVNYNNKSAGYIVNVNAQ